MSIIRVKKDANFSVVCNVCFRDINLSARAKGIMAYLLTLPDDWKLYKTELHTHFSEGRDAINTGFSELEKCGYITKEVVIKDGLLNGWNYTVFETPEKRETSVTGNQLDGKAVTTKYSNSKANTEETKGALRASDIEPADFGEEEETPTPSSAPPPSQKDPTAEKALALSKELIGKMSAARGIKITASPESASFRKLMAKGVTEDQIRRAIDWLSTEDRKRDMPFNIQSSASLYKKWDAVQGSMSRLGSSGHKERAVLKNGVLYFVDKPKCESQYMRTNYLPEHAAQYEILTPEQFKGAK